MTYDSARNLIQRTGTQYRVCFTAHVLRHTFATLTRRNGAEMETVSELLRHASVATTRSIYVHTTVEDPRRALDRGEAERQMGGWCPLAGAEPARER